MVFGKDQSNKGKKFSKETKLKLSLSHKGQISHMLGKKHTVESRNKMSVSKKGKYIGEKSPTWKGGNSKCIVCGNLTSRRENNICIKCYKKQTIKEKAPNWKGGITPKNVSIRCSNEYKDWRTKVFNRDEFTCQDCGKVGGYLEAHHIKQFSEFIELRFDINNGITLCKICHTNRHKRG